MAVFIDLEDAFSNVSLSKLQSILNTLGIPAQYTSWIIKCYKKRNITVETVNGNVSESSSEGIPQGDVLSPIIFLLYTTPLFGLQHDKTDLFQFADDICILAWGKKITEVAERLQKITTAFLRIVESLGMSVSGPKSKAIWFGANHAIYEPKISINGVNVKFETAVKYLGIFLDEKLNFQRHISELLTVVGTRLNILKMFAGNKWGGHPETLLLILKSVIRGKIDYGCTVYGGAAQKWLNKVTGRWPIIKA